MTTYPGNLKADCAAVRSDVKGKARKALLSCLESGAILDDGEEFEFAIGGAPQFIRELLPLLTASEKADFLSDYVLTWDNDQVQSLCDAMTGNSTALISAANDAARWILDDNQDFLAQHCAELEQATRNDIAYQSMKDREVMDIFNEQFGGKP